MPQPLMSPSIEAPLTEPPSKEALLSETEPAPVEPTRVKTFARFFKNYMSISAVVAAALPIPVTSFKLIPTYTAQTSILSTYTSLFCFLLLAFIFYSRHALGRAMFPSSHRVRRQYRFRAAAVGLAPALLITMSLLCIFFYHVSLGNSVSTVRRPEVFSLETVMEKTPLWAIPNGEWLILIYLGIFVFAEAAFIMMALREYLQDLLKISEIELIRTPEQDDVRLNTYAGAIRALAEYRRSHTDERKDTYEDFEEWLTKSRSPGLVASLSEQPELRREIELRLSGRLKKQNAE